MNFGGLNTRVDKTQLGPSESPSCSNAFYVNGSTGLLGPRAGRYITSSTAYADAVYGVSKLKLPGGARKWMASHGTVSNQENAPLATQNYPTPAGVSLEQYTFNTVGPVTFSWPSAGSDTLVALHTSIPAGTYEMLVPQDYTITATSNTGTQIFPSIQVRYYLLDAGLNQVSVFTPLDLLNTKSPVSITHNPSGFHKASLTLASEVTQVRVFLVCTGGSGVSDNTATFSTFNTFYMKRV